ncbi:unnamed protein product [Amoebophrya sp. A120]|nr:unnamed protein product [Amoebophrya sp. A120]|eukprot:GSA120T00018781001.1
MMKMRSTAEELKMILNLMKRKMHPVSKNKNRMPRQTSDIKLPLVVIVA